MVAALLQPIRGYVLVVAADLQDVRIELTAALQPIFLKLVHIFALDLLGIFDSLLAVRIPSTADNAMHDEVRYFLLTRCHSA